jgi:uncharacterized protein involved in exopolysaccharide biosynthesis
MIGGTGATYLVQPHWSATARVMIHNVVVPVTDDTSASDSLAQFVTTQLELVRDFSVAGRVVDQTGWLSDPELIARYQRRPPTDVADFRQWLARNIIQATEVSQSEDSNIIAIRYNAASPRQAKQMAEIIRAAYIDTSVAMLRENAIQNADWLDGQLELAMKDLQQAQLDLASLERSTNIVLADGAMDFDQMRLRSLAQAPLASEPTFQPKAKETGIAGRLARLDALTQTAKMTLGANHPTIQSLSAQRNALERSAASAGGAGYSQAAIGAQSASADRAIEAQKQKVLSQRERSAKLGELLSQVEIKRIKLDQLTKRTEEFRTKANAGDLGIAALGDAITGDKPDYPNRMLACIGSAALGFALGLFSALLFELLTRKVRGAADLETLEGVELLSIIPARTAATGNPDLSDGVRIPSGAV